MIDENRLDDNVLKDISGGAGGEASVKMDAKVIKTVESYCPLCGKITTFEIYSGGRAYCKPFHHAKEM